MAEGLTGFTLYKSYLDSAEEGIPDEGERGMFFYAMAVYMLRGEDISETLPPMAKCCFKCNKVHFDRSIKQSDNRRKTKRNQTEPNETKKNQTKQEQEQEQVQVQGQEQVQEQVQEQIAVDGTSACADRAADGDADDDGKLVGIDVAREIVGHLNAAIGSSYKASSRCTRKWITARMNEGFSVDDFKRVIDNMAAEWGGDERMARYLRPETLFGTKFEGYLQRGRAPAPAFDPRMAGDFERWDDGAEEVAAW